MTYGRQKKHAVRMFWAVDVPGPLVTAGCGHKHRRFEDAEACAFRGGGLVFLRIISTDGTILVNA